MQPVAHRGDALHGMARNPAVLPELLHGEEEIVEHRTCHVGIPGSLPQNLVQIALVVVVARNPARSDR